MRGSSRPKSNTHGYLNVTSGSPASSPQSAAAPGISVSTLLPLSAALLFALTCAAPGAAQEAAENDPAEAGTETVDGEPEEGTLGVLRVELAEARADVAALRESAVEKIDRYKDERARLDELTEEREAAESRAESAEDHHETARLGAARQAASAYKGGDLNMVHAWTGPEGPAEALERGALLSLFGKHRSADLDRAEASRIATDTLADAAGTAEQDQTEATEAADAAREAAQEAIDEQEERAKGLLEEQTKLEAAFADSQDTDSEAERRDEALTDARAAVTDGDGEVSTTDGAGDENPAESTDGDGGCTDTVTDGFDNGQIPESELCPLPQAGEQLRADAAEAFIELDGAFHSEFDRPMCVTDSYRPYHEQVRLFEEMLPGMAAEPGTSAHGLGIAVDLCGGVHELGSSEHQWMLDHGPDYGWDNPDWARGGFEPWHWEFTP
ncbi:hypothetical protein GCM10028793_17760 [Nocardiopsis oceani]